MPALYTEEVQDFPDQLSAEATGWVFLNTIAPNSPNASAYVFDSGEPVDTALSSFILITPNNGYYSGQHGYINGQKLFNVVPGETYTLVIKAGQGAPDCAWYSTGTFDAYSGAAHAHSDINGTEGDQELTLTIVAGSATMLVKVQAVASGVYRIPTQQWRWAHLTIDGPDPEEVEPPIDESELPILFSPDMDWQQPLIEDLEFETAITHYDGDTEKREGLTDIPNRRLAYLVSATNAREALLLESLIAAGQARMFWVPYWRSADWLPSAAIIGQTTLALDTLHKGYDDLHGVMFWQDWFHAEVVELTEVTDSLLTFDPLTSNWSATGRTRAKVVPVYRGLLAPSVGVSYLERSLKQAKVSFDLVA